MITCVIDYTIDPEKMRPSRSSRVAGSSSSISTAEPITAISSPARVRATRRSHCSASPASRRTSSTVGSSGATRRSSRLTRSATRVDVSFASSGPSCDRSSLRTGPCHRGRARLAVSRVVDSRALDYPHRLTLGQRPQRTPFSRFGNGLAVPDAIRQRVLDGLAALIETRATTPSSPRSAST